MVSPYLTLVYYTTGMANLKITMLTENKFPEQKQLVQILYYRVLETEQEHVTLTSAQKSKHKTIINFTILYDISS